MRQARKIVSVGSTNMDIVLPVNRLPRAGETITGGKLEMFPGGKGANQACAAARLGCDATLISQVGSDAFGARLLAELSAAGVNIDHVGTTPEPSGTACIYVVPGGENSIVISPGANALLSPDVAISRLNKLSGADFLLLQLEIPIETVEAVLDWSRIHHARTILDPAPSRLLPQSLLHHVDYLTPNQTEAAALLGNPSWVIQGFADAEVAADGLLALGAAEVVLKLGALGCLVASGKTRSRVRGYQVEAVDATAAGDAFNGALAAALAEGRQLADAAFFACAAAAVSVTRAGAQSSLPTRAQVESFLSQYELRGSQ